VAEVRPYGGIFNLEFVILVNLLEIRELGSALAEFSSQLFLFRVWSDIFGGSFDSRTELIRVKHQLG
jgi:hypothetical protein